MENLRWLIINQPQIYSCVRSLPHDVREPVFFLSMGYPSDQVRHYIEDRILEIWQGGPQD